MPEYVESYPRELKTYVDYEHRRRGVGTPEEEGRMWSHRFGVVLHDGLNGAEPQEDFLKTVPTYMHWNNSIIQNQLQLFNTPADDLETRNESNFHALNRCMIFMWEPFLMGWQSEHARRTTLTYAEHKLAVEGFRYYLEREKYIKEAGGVHALYDSEASDFLISTAGIMLEFDVALAAIDILKHHPEFAKNQTTVVPGPAQFERTHKPHNVDFVVADHTNGRAVGLQSKLRVTERDIEITDHDRVVLIDGSVDLDDVLALRAQKGSSKITVRAWPGILAAKKILEIKTKGKGRSPYINHIDEETAAMPATNNPNEMRQRLRTKMIILNGIHSMQQQAKQLAGHISLDQEKIRGRIGGRILEKL